MVLIQVLDFYTCATVVLAGRLCPPIINLLGEDSLRDCWEKCLSGLQNSRQQSRFAERCHKVLQLIERQIFQPRDGESYP